MDHVKDDMTDDLCQNKGAWEKRLIVSTPTNLEKVKREREIE